MERNKPIGCRVLHFTKMIGQDKICMYCGEVFLKFITVKDKSSGTKFTFRPNKLFNE